MRLVGTVRGGLELGEEEQDVKAQRPVRARVQERLLAELARLEQVARVLSEPEERHRLEGAGRRCFGDRLQLAPSPFDVSRRLVLLSREIPATTDRLGIRGIAERDGAGRELGRDARRAPRRRSTGCGLDLRSRLRIGSRRGASEVSRALLGSRGELRQPTVQRPLSGFVDRG